MTAKNASHGGTHFACNTYGLTLGSLFDGIGVFPLAARQHGIVPIWASEIEKAAISITKRHFPDMEHLGDITKLDGGRIPPVHVLTFGSPCQNFSAIGDRSGLKGEKSSLFYQAIRIIEEMRNASGNRFPAIAVWENVMGTFSSNHGMDFNAVIRTFQNTTIPMPDSGRWAGAGMVRGGCPDLASRARRLHTPITGSVRCASIRNTTKNNSISCRPSLEMLSYS